jgi:hypothetical protein
MDDEYEYLFNEIDRVNHEMAMMDIENITYEEIDKSLKKIRSLRMRLAEIRNYYEVEDFLLNGPGKKVDKI